jgi:hypothetical protein
MKNDETRDAPPGNFVFLMRCDHSRRLGYFSLISMPKQTKFIWLEDLLGWIHCESSAGDS